MRDDDENENETQNEDQRQEIQRRAHARAVRNELGDSKAHHELYAELIALNARLTAVRFKTLVEEGMTRIEALTIIIHRGNQS